MVTLVCPSCKSETEVDDAVRHVECKACGEPLETFAGVGESTLVDSDASLVVELREAFGVGPDGLVNEDSSSIDTLWRRCSRRDEQLDGAVLAIGNRLDDFEIVG